MTEIKTELHILNGDFALGIWRQCGFTGQSLVWRETYLEGPLPERPGFIRLAFTADALPALAYPMNYPKTLFSFASILLEFMILTELYNR